MKSNDSLAYPLHLAIDLLDQLVDASASGAPPRETIIRGAIALALHANEPGDDLVATLRDLEGLVLGDGEALDAQAANRAARLASTLRRQVGVH